MGKNNEITPGSNETPPGSNETPHELSKGFMRFKRIAYSSAFGGLAGAAIGLKANGVAGAIEGYVAGSVGAGTLVVVQNALNYRTDGKAPGARTDDE